MVRRFPRALEFAMAEAARRGAALRVVTRVALPEYYATAYGAYIPLLDDESESPTCRAGTQIVDEVVAARSRPWRPDC